MDKSKRVGEKHITYQGYEIEIVEYFGCENCTIRFKNSTVIRGVQYTNVVRGKIKNPYHSSVFGIGYNGLGNYNRKTHFKIYDKWIRMFERCYNEKFQEKHPTYKDCSVDERWYNFQVFAKWFEENYVEGWDLDKDILVKGNKVYSPETCCFVPNEINGLFIKRQNKRGKYPIGVHIKGKKFVAQLNIKGKASRLGVFNTSEEAFQAYKKAKEVHIKEVADEWKDLIDLRVYEAMYNYKVEITD